MPDPRKKGAPRKNAQSYRHRDADLPARPEIGAQAHFKQAKPPTTYRYDSSLAPELCWDSQNPARETAEALIAQLSDLGLRISDLAAQPPTKERDRALAELRANITDARRRLLGLSGPFLNWAGKAERLSFDVPTLPLFVHERLSTAAILDTLKGHRRNKQDDFLNNLFGFRERPLADQVLRAYEHRDQWVNRLILGDSLVVMNSLLRFESLGGQVQMIYMDPPYGVRFGSNFQPFVRKRDVAHNDDADLTREPEMVQAYRDTWELGLHSYLTYLRDRLLLARELLAPSGSIFVQISDENLHHVREIMDEVFGTDCFICTIVVKKKGSQKSSFMDPVNDYLLWYGKSPRQEGKTKFKSVFVKRELDLETLGEFKLVELPDGREFPISAVPNAEGELVDYRTFPKQLFADHPGARLFRANPLTSGGERKNQSLPFKFGGRVFTPPKGSCWKTTVQTDDGSVPGMTRLAETKRLLPGDSQLSFKRYLDDFGFIPLSNWWDGLGGASEPLYVVQTNTEIVQRCLLMTTDPGDLVLDPTCGSGTTAFVAEQWGRRWITCDTSRVPLALARQRLLTATFDYYQINASRAEQAPEDWRTPKAPPAPTRPGPRASVLDCGSPLPLSSPDDLPNSPANGFVYKRRQNAKGEEVGGIVPHITLKSTANNEPPAEEVLVDCPEIVKGVVRVTGPFTFEATIPAAEGLDTEPETPGIQGEAHENYVGRMLEVLRRAPVLRLPGNKTVTLKNIRPPAKTLALSAEAVVAADVSRRTSSPAESQRGLTSAATEEPPVAILFGPENGAISERLVREAWDEAGLKHYAHLYVIGFAIDPKARQFIESAGQIGIPCTYLQATMDLQMGDLLKNMRSSQVFSVCGLPDVKVSRKETQKGAEKQGEEVQWQVELLGLDTFDPVTMEVDHLKGADVPAWFLDTDYNGMVFRVRQAFFPRTGAWENLKKALRAEFEDTVWDHLAGTTSAPFPAGEHGQIAVKVIDPRGNELLVVKRLEETK
ncbi:MAG: site-specific DNA-methyltransferase [Verrucomicrobia bacterium]|nr:site-specific DNA-methyltransferase [Verrucomicrobiota bacterium]